MAKARGQKGEIEAGRGDAPCDLLLKGGQVFSSTTREFIRTDLAILGSKIVGWGDRSSKATIDVTGKFLVPGFIDAHMHLESTKLWVDEFVKTVLPLGTVAVAADPHELANVMGVPGVTELAKAAADLPFFFGICASPCVPASAFESSAFELGRADLEAILDLDQSIGVAEMMNYPGVISGDPEILDKIAAAGERRVDGHAPGIVGFDLDAYLVAGVESDHECFTYREAHEKRQKGMWVFIREGSASKNLKELITTAIEYGTDRLALCSDDREPDLLLESGHINDILKLAVASGLRAEDALVLATSNPAEYHGMDHLGSLGPGYQADIVVLKDIVEFKAEMVFQKGRLVAENGVILPGVVEHHLPASSLYNSVHLKDLPNEDDFKVPVKPDSFAKAISVEKNSLITKSIKVRWDPADRELSRLSVVERHRNTGRLAVGLVKNFGIYKGAIASTVAHDAHNIMVLGGNSHQAARDMVACVRRLREIGGGQVVFLDGELLAELPLPIAGLMSDRPAREVSEMLKKVNAGAAVLGCIMESPFMQLSFLGLSVIPELKLTDQGLVDVNAFSLTSLAY